MYPRTGLMALYQSQSPTAWTLSQSQLRAGRRTTSQNQSQVSHTRFHVPTTQPQKLPKKPRTAPAKSDTAFQMFTTSEMMSAPAMGGGKGSEGATSTSSSSKGVGRRG